MEIEIQDNKNKELLPRIINVSLAMAGAVIFLVMTGIFWDSYYCNYESVVIKDILSGALTGSPDGHVYFILYPLSGIIAFLYRLIPFVNWFGVLLCGVNGLAIYLFIRRVLTYTHRIYFKVMVTLFAAIAYGAALLRYAVLLDYRITGGIAIALGIFAYLTIKDTFNLKVFLGKCVASILLFFIGYCLNPEAFYISVPFLVIACGIKVSNGVLRKRAKKTNKDSLFIILISNDSLYKYSLLPIITALLLFACTLINKGVYRSEEWKDFDSFYENYCTVYELQGKIPGFEQDNSVYEAYGVDEYRYTLLEDKNFALLDEFDAGILEVLKEDNANKFDLPYEITYSDAVDLYFKGVDFFNSGFLTIGLLILYMFLLTASVVCGKKRFVFGAVAIFFARNICGVFAYMTGVHMATNVTCLTIVEGFLLVGNIVMIVPYLTTASKKSTKPKKVIALVTRIVIIAVSLLCIYPLVVNIKRIKVEYDGLISHNERWVELENYFKNNSGILYVCDTNSIDSYSEKVFIKKEAIKNYITAGGFVSQMPVYKKRLLRAGMENLTEDILQDNAYWVTENTNSITWMEAYYDTMDRSIDATEKDMLKATIDTKYIIYTIVPYTFGEEFAGGGYDSLFLAQFAAESFNTERFNVYLGCNIYSTQETQSLRKIAKMTKTALSVRSDISNVWIELDPFNYNYSDESAVTTQEIYDLERIVLDNPQVTFNFIFNFPGEAVWNENEDIIALKVDSYKKIFSVLSKYANTSFDFPGYTEWVLCNNSINNGKTIDYGVTDEIIAEWICRTYAINEENIEEKFEELTKICEECRNTKYGDLSDKKLVFFGDSIIGNYTTASGVAAATESLCNITTDNKAVGGTTASVDFVNAVDEYFADNKAKGQIYVINYGFNDFLQRLSIEGSGGYKEGLRAGIDRILDKDSKAQIVIVSPYYSDGTSMYAIEGPSMAEYVIACKDVALEKNCYFINNYDELLITDYNLLTYVCADHVHLNQAGRIKYAQILARRLTEWFAS